ncbi:MAG: hypothetical protein A2Y38_07460 [Spirochaetes bacterium GWB1_59_5]|nr:MAG: hypothetical protein A2Y38_07460 [Spirochaetes bacterium GWB1_59_5]
MKIPSLISLYFTLSLAPLLAVPVEVSVESAVELASRASVELYGQKLAVESAQRDLGNSWNLFLPGISMGLSAKTGDKFLAPAILGNSGPGFGSTLSLGTKLTLTSGVLYDLEKQRTSLRSALLEERDLKARLARDVQKAYFQLVSLQLELENKAKAIVLAEERRRLADLRFARGLGSELDALRAQMSELNARSAHKKAVSDYDKRQTAFRRQLGLAAGDQLRLTTALEVPAVQPADVIATLIDTRIDLAKASLARKIAAVATAKFINLNRLPLVTLDAGWSFSLADFKTSRDNFSISASLSFNADAWIPGSRKDLELLALRETEDRLARSHEQIRRSALDEVEALRLDLEFARNSLELASGQISLSERIAARTREAWERGAATALELEDAQYAVDSAKQTLIASQYQYLSLLIDLGYALNTDWKTLYK